jgi:hypothetical protein
MNKLFWICGKPGSGKTTLLRELEVWRPDLACFDADACRSSLYPGLGYTLKDRMANVSILTELGCQVARYGGDSAVAAVTPTHELRNHVQLRADELGVELHFIHLHGRQRALWEGSVYEEFLRTGLHLDMSKHSPLTAANEVIQCWLKQPARQLFIGRWQPFHTGHQAIICQALENGPVAIGVRLTTIDKDNPEGAMRRMLNIREEFKHDDVEVFLCPDIDSIHIGRGVGYDIVKHAEVPGVSGTKLRKERNE